MNRSPSLFIWFYLAKILANLAVFSFLPILPLFLTQQDAGLIVVGAFFSVLAVARLAFGLVGGWLADTLGHLHSLALGSLIGLSAFILLIFLPAWGWTLTGMVLIYAASALTTPSQSAFIGSTTGENRGKAFGIMNTIHTAAQMGGPILGAWLVEAKGFPMLFQSAGVLYLLAAVIRLGLSVRSTERSPRSPAAASSFTHDLTRMRTLLLAGGLLAWMLLADGFGDVAMSLTETYQPIFLEQAGLSITQIGLIGSLAYGATLVSHSISGWMVDRYGERLPAFLSFAMTGAGILAFAFGESFVVFTAAWMLIGLMWGLGGTAYDSLISRAVPERHRGMAYGIFSTAQGFFSLPMPLLGGWLYGMNAMAPFITAAGVSVLAAWVAFGKFPDLQPAQTGRNRLPEPADL